MVIKQALWVLLGAVLVTGCSPDVDEKTSIKPSTEPKAKSELAQRYDEIKANSTEEKIKAFNEKPDDDSSSLSELFMSEMKKTLPVLIDDATLLTEVTEQDGMLFYRYTLKGIPNEVLVSERWQQNMRDILVHNYCVPEAGMALLRETFPKGITHNYYKSNDLIFTYVVTPANCH